MSLKIAAIVALLCLCCLGLANAETRVGAGNKAKRTKRVKQVKRAKPVARSYRVPALRTSMLRAASKARKTGAPGRLRVPAYWRTLRTFADSKLPTHRQDDFKATLGPSIVSNGFDTVAGLGLRGNF